MNILNRPPLDRKFIYFSVVVTFFGNCKYKTPGIKRLFYNILQFVDFFKFNF